MEPDPSGPSIGGARADGAPLRERLLEDARDPRTTPFDYIVVGSGAGGGPLAARLAEAGRRVLVLEAGADTARPEVRDNAARPLTEVYEVPGYHAAATEDPA